MNIESYSVHDVSQATGRIKLLLRLWEEQLKMAMEQAIAPYLEYRSFFGKVKSRTKEEAFQKACEKGRYTALFRRIWRLDAKIHKVKTLLIQVENSRDVVLLTTSDALLIFKEETC